MHGARGLYESGCTGDRVGRRGDSLRQVDPLDGGDGGRGAGVRAPAVVDGLAVDGDAAQRVRAVHVERHLDLRNKGSESSACETSTQAGSSPVHAADGGSQCGIGGGVQGGSREWEMGTRRTRETVGYGRCRTLERGNKNIRARLTLARLTLPSPPKQQ